MIDHFLKNVTETKSRKCLFCIHIFDADLQKLFSNTTTGQNAKVLKFKPESKVGIAFLL